MRVHVVAVVVLGALGARGAARAPATKPAPSATTCAAEKVDPGAKKILDGMETAGAKYAAVRADVVYKVINTTLGDSEQRAGWVCYQKEMSATDPKAAKKKTTPAKFRIHFATLRQGKGPVAKNEVDYAFDGRWLTVAKAAIKTVTRYQVTPKGHEPKSLKIGQGPFPLPFGQRAGDMVWYFECTTRKAGKDDPKDTAYLKLVPRAEHRRQFDFDRLQMWVHTKTHLPVKIVSRDKSRNLTTVTFAKVDTGIKPEAKIFRIPKPFGWKLVIKPLRQGDNLRP